VIGRGRSAGSNRFRPLQALFLLAVLLPGVGAGAQPKEQPPARPLLAVLELDNRLSDSKEDRDSRSYLTDLIRNRAKDLLPWLEVITRENVTALLSAQGKTIDECQKEGECEVQTGARLGADYVVSGGVLRVGGELRLLVKLHDTHTKGLLKGLTIPGKDIRELESNVARGVDQLLTPLLTVDAGSGKAQSEGATTGELLLMVSPPGATYQIDGGSAREAGKSGSALATVALSLGKHRVSLRLAGYQDSEREILVQPGLPVTLKETLLRPPPRHAATAGKGFLTVESTPDQARIFLDGEDTGRSTPANFLDLAPGEHEIVLKRNLYLDHRARRVLRDDIPDTLLVPLTPDFGTAVIESNPSGASISIDGELREERTPARIERLPSGAHRVELSLARHTGAQRTLLVEPGGSPSWTAELSPTFALIKFESDPPGSTLFIDDVETGTTPLERELDRGSHRIRLRKRLYAEHVELLVVEAGKATKVAPKLSARFGSLRVSAFAGGQPVDDAEVLVEGQSRGLAPIVLDELPESVVTIEVRAPLHRSFTTEVKIASGPAKEVKALLVPEYGFVKAAADQPATVEVDGTVRGPANGTSIKVHVGSRRVVLRPAQPARYRPFEGEVVVTPLGTEQISGKLEERLGKLVILSTPSGAALTIDGQDHGQTPGRLELFAGSVSVQLKKERFIDWTGTALVKEGETASLAVEMKGVDLAKFEEKQRSDARFRAAMWGLAGVVLAGGAAVAEVKAHGFSSDEASAVSRYGATIDPQQLAAARSDAMSAASSARTTQRLAVGLAGAAIVPLIFVVWNLVSTP
jgi:TolB-like protein